MPTKLTTLATVIAAFAVFATAPSHAREEMPEVSHDGLHLVKKQGFAAFYLKPGASLRQYDELAILECFVAFKKNWQREQRDQDRFVSAKQMDDIKQHLSQEFHEVFVKELQEKGGYQVVTSGGHDVLLLRPAIVDLDVTAPDSLSDGSERTFSATAGEMTLYLELYDSVTSDLLARIIDPKGGQGGEIQWQGSVTNKAEADRILERWADNLRRYLDEARQHTTK